MIKFFFFFLNVGGDDLIGDVGTESSATISTDDAAAGRLKLDTSGDEIDAQHESAGPHHDLRHKALKHSLVSEHSDTDSSVMTTITYSIHNE